MTWLRALITRLLGVDRGDQPETASLDDLRKALDREITRQDKREGRHGAR